MTVTLNSPNVGLFNRLGRLVFAEDTLTTALLTTVPTQVNDAINEYDDPSLEVAKAISDLAQATTSWTSQGQSLMNALRTAAERTVNAMVEADNPQERKTLTTYLEELIAQMTTASATVDRNTPAATPTAGGSNAGNGNLLLSIIRGDGRNNENLIAEDLVGEMTGASSLTLSGETSVTRMAADWPQGSGASATISVTEASSNLLANSDMEDEDDVANTPDDWTVVVGTVGTTIKMTDVEVQRIVVTGSPSAGTYVINWTNQASKAQSTTPLAYNASESTVQSALRALVGLELVTVASSGTSPNFTHVITFAGVGGNLSQVTVTNNTTGGTFTPSTTTTGSTHVHSGGKALEFDADVTQLTEIRQRLVGLKAETPYCFNGYFKVDVVPAAGILTVDLFDGSAIINDTQGTANSFTIAATGLTTSYAAKNGVFRLPRTVPELVYLRIRISTGVSNGTSVYIDHCALAEMREVYQEGFFAALFAGSTAFSAGDTFTVATTNDRAGQFQTAFDRNFDMRSKRLLLPSAASGTIPDTLIA